MPFRSVPPAGRHVAAASGAGQSSAGPGIELIEAGGGRAGPRLRVTRTMISGQDTARGVR